MKKTFIHFQNLVVLVLGLLIIPISFSESENLESENLEFKNSVSENLASFEKENHILNFQSSLSFKRNNLSRLMSIEIPYAEIDFLYFFSDKNLLRLELDLSYKKGEWNYLLDEFFIHHKNIYSLDLDWGYFSYPVSYILKNEKIFLKNTLVHQALFPEDYKALGISVSQNKVASFSWKISLQSPLQLRETDSFHKIRLSPVFTTSLFYEEENKNVFLSYLHQNLFLEGGMRALGLGSDAFFRSFYMGFKGEFWRIERSQPSENLWAYYIFPYFQWKNISLGALFGRKDGSIKQDSYQVQEYLLKGDVALSKNLFLTLEWFKEVDSIVKQEEWILSLKTNF